MKVAQLASNYIAMRSVPQHICRRPEPIGGAHSVCCAPLLRQSVGSVLGGRK